MNDAKPVQIELVDTLNVAGAEHCRQKLLDELKCNKMIEVVFIPGSGYSAAFLNMVFGGLKERESELNLNPAGLENHVRFTQEEEPSMWSYVALARRYMNTAVAA